MRDYSSAYPDAEMLEIYVPAEVKVIKVQAFWQGEGKARHIYSPELGSRVWEYFTTFEDAKRHMIYNSERTVEYILDKIRRIKDLKEDE